PEVALYPEQQTGGGGGRKNLLKKPHPKKYPPAGRAVDSVGNPTFHNNHVVELTPTRRCAFRRRGDKGRDLFRHIRIGNVVSAHTAVEESADHDLVGLPGRWDRWVLVNIVRAEPPAAIGIGVDGRQRAGGSGS